MHKRLEEVLAFSCPTWEDLPPDPIFNQEVVDYINGVLAPIWDEEPAITPTMIQNYSKWGVMPKPEGRKYDRRQISSLIIITIYKQIINLKDIKAGFLLQLRLNSLEEGYNYFAAGLNASIQRIFKAAKEDRHILLDGYRVKKGTEGLEVVINAFTLKLLGTIIIQSGGFEGTGDIK